jgi:hypothetical protein
MRVVNGRGRDWDGRAFSAATVRYKVGSRGGIVGAATPGNPVTKALRLPTLRSAAGLRGSALTDGRVCKARL